MAYSIFGYIKLKDQNGNCVPAGNATIYAYFNKVDSNSSPSQWCTTPYITDSNGYYTVTIEDNNFIGINAAYKRGLDEVWLAVVYGDNTLNSTILTHASFYVHKLTNNDYNEVNLDVLPKRAPIINDYTQLPSIIHTNTTYNLTVDTIINTFWENGYCYPTSVSQKKTYANVPIFSNHDLDYIEYDIQDKVLTNTVGNVQPISFGTPGDRNISITVYEKWGTASTVTQTVQVKYNEPTVNFYWTPETINDEWDTNTKIRGNETITFINSSTDIDNRANQYTYSFIIHDTDLNGNDVTKTFSNLSLVDSIQYNFASPGTKTVELVCYWNDGYADQVTSVSKTINIYEQNVIINSINQLNASSDRWTAVNFNVSLTGNLNAISNVKWTINDYYDAYNPDNGTYGAQVDNTTIINTTDYSAVVSHNYQSYSSHPMVVEVTYNTGWEEKTVTDTSNVVLGYHTLAPDFVTDNNKSVVGKVPVIYSDNTNDSLNLFKTGQYSIRDESFDGTYTIATSGALQKTDTFVYTFNTPSRKPFSAVNGDSAHVYNKEVTYTITYDNGWNITSTYVIRNFEASPLEFDANIIVRPNVDGVSW